MSAFTGQPSKMPSRAPGHSAPDTASPPERRRWYRGHPSLTAGLAILAAFYLVVIFSDFLAPYDYRAQSLREPFQAPSGIHFKDTDGRWHPRPFIYERRLADPLARSYVEETSRPYSLEFFARGYTYDLLGLIKTDRHLFGVQSEDGVVAPRLYLLGTDELGRDRFSRLLSATRFSLVVGPLATLLAGALGILIGCIAGYSGRLVDGLLMRAADVMMALPTLVLVLAARAAFPLELPPARAAVLLITIFVALGWAEMSRLARGLVIDLRHRDFALAAVSLGATPARVLSRHILPNASRHLMVQLLLILPAFLLAETSLSFLGVGLQEPEASWGTLLAAAADIRLLESGHALVLLTPAFAIALFVLGARLLANGIQKDRSD